MTRRRLSLPPRLWGARRLGGLAAAIVVATACSKSAAPPPAGQNSGGGSLAEGGGNSSASAQGGQGGAPSGQGAATSNGGAGGSDIVAPCTQAPTVRIDDAMASSSADFGSSPAHGNALVVEITFRNHCEEKLLFLGHPNDWVGGTGFSIASLPPVAIAPGEQGSLTLSFQPAEEGVAAGTLALPHDQPGSPLALDLSATVTPPRSLVFVGDGGHRMTTLDYGATFAHDSFDTLVGHGDTLQRGVCAGQGRFVAVGGNVDRRWWTSDDGLSWTAHQQAGSPLGSCAFGNGWFVAFDGGGPQRSSDGIVWSNQTGPYAPNHLRSIAFAGDRFVASGDNGRVAVTMDGTQWDHDQQLATGDLRRVIAGGGLVVAAGSAGWVATSSDGGQNWTAQQVGSADHGGIVYHNGTFFLAGGGSLHSSTDGLVWQTVNATAAVPRASFGRYLFGTNGNDVLRSEDGGFSWTTLYTSPGGIPVNHAVLEAPQ
jgi:hypothetical protein